MNKRQYEAAWDAFWNQSIVKEMPWQLSDKISSLVDAPDYDFMPPLVGYSQKNKCYIVAWVDLGDAVFDIAYFLDGKAGWYFRDGDKIDATHADPPRYVDWNEVPHAPLERFKICLEVTDDA